MPFNAASWFPDANCRIGFRAHTYPVTREKIGTPILPCTRTRTIGYWKNRGEAPSAEVGLKRSGSKARVRWVNTTRRDATPRRPCQSSSQLSLYICTIVCAYGREHWRSSLYETAHRGVMDSHLPISHSPVDWHSFCLLQSERRRRIDIHDYRIAFSREGMRCDCFEKSKNKYVTSRRGLYVIRTIR
jgi:hypothetical protein